MDLIDALPRAQAEFGRRLAVVAAEQWPLPTPCDEWTVRDLVNHVVAAARMYQAMLGRCSQETAAQILTSDALGDDDPRSAFTAAAAAVTRAFLVPGALNTVCHHPLGDLPAGVLLGYRINDDLVHTWDLAAAIGDDEALPPELVATAWQIVEPALPMLGPESGFKRGPSGDLSESAPLQHRWLDAQGRRP